MDLGLAKAVVIKTRYPTVLCGDNDPLYSCLNFKWRSSIQNYAEKGKNLIIIDFNKFLR